MRRFVPVLAALAMGGISATAMAAGAYTTTTADPGVRTGTTVTTAPDASGMMSNTQVVETFDATLGREFELEREIVDRAAAVYGVPATFASGRDLPPTISDAIVEGNMLPEGTPVRPVPDALGSLPTLQQGDRWVASGEHLIEVTPDGRIAMVIYDVLP